MTSVALVVTDRGTVSAGRRRAEKKAGPWPKRLSYVAVHVIGIAAAATAWVFLVRAAITFGQVARDGRSAAWVVCGSATLGAAACLLLGFVLLARSWALLGLRNEYTPRRSSGGRRSR